MIVACEVSYTDIEHVSVITTREKLENMYRVTAVPLDGKWKIYNPKRPGSLEGLNIPATTEGTSIVIKMIMVEEPVAIPKWQPQHFPTGTVVVLKNYKNEPDGSLTYCSGGNAEFIVKSVRMTNTGNYLLDSGIQNKSLDDMNYVFNVAHVTSIKSRGAGPVKMEHWRNYSKMINLKSEITYDVLNKRRYYSTCVRELLAFLIHNNKSFQAEMGLRRDYVELFMRQSFVKSYRFPGGWHGYVSVDKKKAKRWLQQNINRLLMTRKESNRIEEEMRAREYAEYCRDLDNEYHREYGENSN